MTVDEPDGSAQALAANRFGADLYLGVAPSDEAVTIAYYAVPGFESVGGRRLAQLLCDGLAVQLGMTVDAPHGMRLAVLRETRMPAVLCELGPVREVVRSAPKVVGAIGVAVNCWVEAPSL
jgi:N-acetylmuramoyl-L-alanine amidase